MLRLSMLLRHRAWPGRSHELKAPASPAWTTSSCYDMGVPENGGPYSSALTPRRSGLVCHRRPQFPSGVVCFTSLLMLPRHPEVSSFMHAVLAVAVFHSRAGQVVATAVVKNQKLLSKLLSFGLGRFRCRGVRRWSIVKQPWNSQAPKPSHPNSKPRT